MSAAKANNNKDTYKATAITLIVFGVLYLVDKLLHFSTLGLSWVMNRDNFCCIRQSSSCYSNTINR